MGFDTTLDASVLTSKLSATYSSSSSHEISRNSVNIVLYAKSSFSGATLDLSSARYIPWAQKLLDQRKYADFTRLCGPELVSTVSKGAVLAVVITIDGLSEAQKSQMDLKVSGSTGFGPFSAKAQAHFEKLRTSSSSRVSIGMQAYVRGGSGIPAFQSLAAALVNQSVEISKLSEGISDALKSLQPEQGAVTGFRTIPFPDVNQDEEDFLTAEKSHVLRKVAVRYREHSKRAEFMDEFLETDWLTRPNPEERDGFTPELLEQARGELPLLKAYVRKLAETHRACLAAPSIYDAACTIDPAPLTPYSDRLYIILTEFRSS
jgi:hypothetical protein